MQLSELRADVRAELDEDTAGFWTDAMLNRWINAGNLDIARRLEDLEATELQDSVASQANYDLPSDCLDYKLKRVLYKNDGTNYEPLYWIDFVQLNSIEGDQSNTLTDTGKPLRFYLWENDIWLQPVPAAAVTDGLKLYYYKRPATLTEDTDTPEHQTQLHSLIVLYACYRGLKRDTLYTDSQRYFDEYLEGVQEAEMSLRTGQRTRVRQIHLME